MYKRQALVYHDISQEQLLLLITQAVQAELQKRSRQVPVGISVRHNRLTACACASTFWAGSSCTRPSARTAGLNAAGCTV